MKQSKYTSIPPDENGYVSYNESNQRVWNTLFERQLPLLQTRACSEYLEGIKKLEITANVIPQVPDVNERLQSMTGWRVEPVPALINYKRFFDLLADRRFPAATFIRLEEEIDYIQEPDIFHEIFGHCPLLTVPVYADFMQAYGEVGQKANPKDQAMLARLYWFTVEFGLIQRTNGLKIFGGGILSSIGETVYAIESDKPKRIPLNPVEAFRTPYRIDIFQNIYFVIESFSELFQLIERDLIADINEARKLGMHPPSFPPKEKGDKPELYRFC